MFVQIAELIHKFKSTLIYNPVFCSVKMNHRSVAKQQICVPFRGKIRNGANLKNLVAPCLRIAALRFARQIKCPAYHHVIKKKDDFPFRSMTKQQLAFFLGG